MKISRLGAELFDTDGRTANNRFFYNFANMPNKNNEG